MDAPLAKVVDALRLTNKENLHLLFLGVGRHKTSQCLIYFVILLWNIAAVHLLTVLFHIDQLLLIQLRQLLVRLLQQPYLVLKFLSLLLIGLKFGHLITLELHQLGCQFLEVFFDVALLLLLALAFLLIVSYSLI